ncbi:tetratricopeptide repeat protein [Roseovarius salinarum]|uniref:tetratricopeptide repeat protein n=1 Tax=Roseovarius salinarum TaxID=1981892 RepID=UPI000C332EA9|nr:tetratricopeptide repeat protein [Roseovarius salinarum]
MRRLVTCVVLAAAVAVCAPVAAQDRQQTLADIRQELSVLHVEIRKLKRELSTTQGVAQPSGEGTMLEWVNAIEGALQRLTAKTEELEHRINRIVRDGTNRLGDLEFRLCELEADCDIAELEQGTTLGGGDLPEAGSATAPAETTGEAESPQMAVSEEADFRRAQEALEAGDTARAARLFREFRDTYPAGPLTARAALGEGAALEAMGETKKAARVYLDLFSADQSGPQAPEALFRLGRSLGRLGQTEQACITLAEIGNRFPLTETVPKARQEMRDLGCQ